MLYLTCHYFRRHVVNGSQTAGEIALFVADDLHRPTFSCGGVLDASKSTENPQQTWA